MKTKKLNFFEAMSALDKGKTVRSFGPWEYKKIKGKLKSKTVNGEWESFVLFSSEIDGNWEIVK